MKGLEAEDAVNRDGLIIQGSTVTTPRILGTKRVNAEISRSNQAKTKLISSKKVALKRCSLHVKLLKNVKV